MISEETDKELPYLPSIMGKPYCKHQLQYGSPFIYIAQKSNSFNKDLYVLRNLLMAIFLILPGLLLVINSFSKAVSAMADFIASTLFLYPHTNFAPVIDFRGVSECFTATKVNYFITEEIPGYICQFL